MSAWINNVKNCSLSERFHGNKYLARNYTLNGEVEISYFKSNFIDGLDEIYIHFGVFTGMLYAEKIRSLRVFLRLSIAIENEYLRNKGEPSDDFIYDLTKKYCIIRTDELFQPPDIFKSINEKLENNHNEYVENEYIIFE